MFKFAVFCVVIALANAASLSKDESNSTSTTTSTRKPVVPVLRFESDKQPDGSFRFTYESGDQSYREETGVVQNVGTEDEALEVSGSYRYIDADGNLVEVSYTAGRNGFVPVGTNILPRISEAAKAAADLPKLVVEEKEKDKDSTLSKSSKADESKKDVKA